VGDLRLLDLYCGAGGAGAGYHRAGYEVVGVDHHPQPHYPGTFHHADALDYLAHHGAEYDLIHASPPCQRYSRGTAGKPRHHYPALIAVTRNLMKDTGVPYVIENVPDAQAYLRSPIMLCGKMFGLSTEDSDGQALVLHRHRYFETSIRITPPPHPRHQYEQVAGIYGGGGNNRRRARTKRRGGYVPNVAVQRRLLDIDWMTAHELKQAIPPAYTHWLGQQLKSHLRPVPGQ